VQDFARGPGQLTEAEPLAESTLAEGHTCRGPLDAAPVSADPRARRGNRVGPDLMADPTHAEEDVMARRTIGRGVLAGVLMGTFAAGFLCGSVSQHRADAQMKELGETLMKQAAGTGGVLGLAGDLGSSLVEMQDHVSGLQKNIDALKKVQSALTGK